MLTRRMQIQAIADRLAGLEVSAQNKDFEMPWQLCWQAITSAQPGQEQNALDNAILGLPEAKQILETILATRPGYRPEIQSLEDIAPGLPPIEWVWDGWIPRGLLTVLGASQGSGKSFVATDLAYRIIHNQGFPNGAPIKRPGANVIYVDAEMVPQILNERAQNYGMDRSKLFLMLAEPGEMIDLGQARYQERLTEMAAILKPELIIIDSLSSIHNGGQNNVEDVRSLIGYLTRLGGWANCGLVLVHHIRKPAGGGQRMMNVDLGMEDLSGSGYITQQARVVLGLHVVQTGPKFDPNGPREFKMLKNSIGQYPEPLGFSFAPLHPAGVMLKWETKAPETYRQPNQTDECKAWLENWLKEHPEGVKARQVVESGQQFGFSRAMIFRVRKELACHIQNTDVPKSPDNHWKWSDQALELMLSEDEND
jgi:RecA-family ATPase